MILITIGRNQNNRLVINHPSVSGFHAEIKLCDDGSIFLIDKSSTNGTAIKGKRIQTEVEVLVNRGDKITFAGVIDLEWKHIPTLALVGLGWELYSIGCDLNNRIQINDASGFISRFHATLKIDSKGKIYINDHSANGTFVNGIRIPSNQDYPVKRRDKIMFSNSQPLDWKRIKNRDVNLLHILLSVAAVLIIGLGIIGWQKDWFSLNKSIDKYQEAIVMIYNEYYYVIEFDDKGAGASIIVGQDGNGNFVAQGFGDMKPFAGYGTGFFITKDAKIVTNRHVAMPWEYSLSDENNDKMRQYINKVQQYNLNEATGVIKTLIDKGNLTKEQYEELLTVHNRIQGCRIKNITGISSNLRVGYFGEYYESHEKFDPCIMLTDSKDENIDIAIIQRYNKKLPTENTPVIDIENIVDDKKLKVGDMLYTIGYPSGPSYLTLRNDDGGLKTVMKKGEISREPGKIELDFNIEIIAGASGSPLFDNSGRFVGIVSSRFVNSSTNGKGVLGKYVKKIVEEAK